jgi:hypothetical protein
MAFLLAAVISLLAVACAPTISEVEAAPQVEPAVQHVGPDEAWSATVERERLARPRPYAGTEDPFADAWSTLLEHDGFMPPTVSVQVGEPAVAAVAAPAPPALPEEQREALGPVVTDPVAPESADDGAMRASLDGSILRINVGGGEVVVDGVVWKADAFVHSEGAVFRNANLTEIAGAVHPELYASERNTGSGAAGAWFDYAIPLEPGRYTVILHFAEIYFGTPGAPEAEVGQRRFDVLLEGEVVLSEYDIIAAAGAAATAVTATFTLEIADGALDLVVRNGSAERGKLSAIEIHPASEGG